MSKTKIKILFILIAVSGFFSAVSITHADTILYDNSMGCDNWWNCRGDGVYDYYNGSNVVIPFFVSSNGKLNKAEIIGYTGTPITLYNIQLQDASGNVLDTAPDVSFNWPNGLPNYTNDVFFQFSGNYSVQTGTNYKIAYTVSGSYIWHTATGANGGWLKIYGAVPQTTLSFIFPTDGTSNAGQFSYWQVQMDTNAGISGTVYVEYGNNETHLDYLSAGSGQSFAPGSFDFNIPIGIPLQLIPGNNGFFSARAYIADIAGNRIAESGIINFSNTGAYTNAPPSFDYPQPAFSSSTASFSGASWSCPLNLFGNDLFDICATAQYLIVPQQSDLDKFTNLKNDLASKVPFAYFYELQSIYDNAVSNGGSDNFPTLSINTAGTPLAMNIVIFSKDTIEKFAGSSNVQLFRSLIGYSLWLGFAYLVYYEIRNFRRKREEK